MERQPWMDAEPPPNYVAGLGRGATGFTTRSDIGPARASSFEGSGIIRTDDNGEDLTDSNYDEFEGYKGSSFVDPNATYDQDDKEADEIWNTIDNKMDSRRKRRREERLQEEMKKYRQTRPKIQQMFADVKRDLSNVTPDEWENLPDNADFTRKHKKKAQKDFGFMPVPDSVSLVHILSYHLLTQIIEKTRQENEQFTMLDARQQNFDGFDTPGGTMTPVQDLMQVGEARKQVLGIHLNTVSDSVSGQTVVNPKEFLTGLASVKQITEAEVGDMKKARLLLRSVRTTNPKHAPGWIASARLEEVAGKMLTARKLITQACQICADSEDVWIEAARLHTVENAKVILAEAVKKVPNSVKVWMQAAQLETDITAKKRVFRKALEFIPTSVRLWKAAIELESPDDARVMLGRAVECVPHSVEMWLALAKLETYENARKVLNKARETIPTDASIWITAANLEEAHGNEEGVKAIIKRAVKSLAAHQVVIDREQWIKEAEQCEKNGYKATCQAIIKETIGIGVDDEDRKRTWIEDAETRLTHGAIETTRAIYAHALSVFPGKKSLWLRVAHLEKNHGTKEALDAVLKKAVSYCPQAEVLWLMAAKEKWMTEDISEARTILQNAFASNPDSEQIWLAAVKLENEAKQTDRARQLLKRARERAGTARVWLKSALLERDAQNTEEEKNLLEEAIKKYPQFPKFWMMRGQLDERLGHLDTAREVYQRGLKNCPNSVPLWVCMSNLEEKSSAAKARSLLEKARLMNPKNPELWLAAVRVEMRAGNPKVAQTMMAKALQECPNSGLLWAETIEMETPQQKKAKSVEALKRCDNDPFVIAAVAKTFWADRKVDKARTWFNRAVTINPDYGDAWAWYYRLELLYGTEQQQQDIVKRCAEAEPHHGELWIKVSKDIANTKLTAEQILKKVAASLPVDQFL